MGTLCDFCSIKSTATQFLNKEEMERLNNNCVQVNFSKGDIIFKQDAYSSNIIYVNKGLVKIHIKGPHTDQIIKITKAPSYLGIPTTFGNKINQYSATAIADTKVCFINIDVFKQFIMSNGKFAYELIIGLCQNELSSFKRCANRTQKNIYGRFADALLFFHKEVYEENEFELPLSRSEIGNLIDTSRESVSRIINDFKNDGIININGKKVEILNEKLLEAISNKG